MKGIIFVSFTYARMHTKGKLSAIKLTSWQSLGKDCTHCKSIVDSLTLHLQKADTR